VAYWITLGVRNYVSNEMKFVMKYVNEYKVLPQMTMEGAATDDNGVPQARDVSACAKIGTDVPTFFRNLLRDFLP
jgi:hypothetical protein